jgi:F-type H+-transporting ATPase subunit a
MIDFAELITHHLMDAPLAQWGPVPVTKHLVMMWIAGGIALVFTAAAARTRGKLRTTADFMVEFVRNDVVEPYLHGDTRRYLPYFLTLFLMIFLMNLLGLVPFGATATGNMSVTAALSILTFFLIHVSGIHQHGFFHHFGNLVPHGVPLVLAPLIFLLEFMGFLTKSLALCIRLFANMTAGHIVLLLFLGMILLFGQQSPKVGFAVAPVAVLLALGLYMLELIVALIQAYVFTLLTAIFVGGSLHPEH